MGGDDVWDDVDGDGGGWCVCVRGVRVDRGVDVSERDVVGGVVIGVGGGVSDVSEGSVCGWGVDCVVGDDVDGEGVVGGGCGDGGDVDVDVDDGV